MISGRKVKRQGNEAEHQVSALLHSLGDEYVVFDNVMLNRGRHNFLSFALAEGYVDLI